MAVLSFFANPHRFMAASKWFAWGFTVLGSVVIAIGVYLGLFVVPPDAVQGDSARIMFAKGILVVSMPSVAGGGVRLQPGPACARGAPVSMPSVAGGFASAGPTVCSVTYRTRSVDYFRGPMRGFRLVRPV